MPEVVYARPQARARERLVVVLTTILLSCTALIAWPALASAAVTYAAVGNGLALHNQPSLASNTVVQRVNNGAPLRIVCQIQNGPNVGGNRTWDKLDSGFWVTDYYTTSPSFNSYAPGLGDCNAPPPPPAPTVLGGVNLQTACEIQHSSAPGSPGTSVFNADPHTAYTWGCIYFPRATSGLGVSPTSANVVYVPMTGGIDVNAACRWDYWDDAAHAALRDMSPSGWYCVK
jgi:hypothetical protein